MDNEDDGPRLHICDVDGASDVASASMGECMPVYASWSPDGTLIATLAQRGQQLALEVLDARTADGGREIEHTSPLFFTWAGDRIAAFAGGGPSEPPLLGLYDPSGMLPPVRMPSMPRNFCTPVWQDPNVFYVAGRDGHPTLLRADVHTGVARALEQLDGLIAITMAPDGTNLGRAVAYGGDGSPYTDLAIVDPHDGASRRIRDEPCLAFLWAPGSDRMVIAAVDTEANVLNWSVLDVKTGEEKMLLSMRPTRELAFYLRFFEQYHQTHPIVSPDGSYLLAGGDIGDGTATGATPHIWKIPLDGSPPSSIGEGVFGVFPPWSG